MANASERDVFGDYRSLSAFIDVSNQGFRKSLFPANQNTYFFHYPASFPNYSFESGLSSVNIDPGQSRFPICSLT